MTQPTPWIYLRRARRRAGYSLTRLAAATDTHVSHLCKVEAGTRGLSPELRLRVAKVLDVDIDELIHSAPQPPAQVPPTSAVAS